MHFKIHQAAHMLSLSHATPPPPPPTRAFTVARLHFFCVSSISSSPKLLATTHMNKNHRSSDCQPRVSIKNSRGMSNSLISISSKGSKDTLKGLKYSLKIKS